MEQVKWLIAGSLMVLVGAGCSESLTTYAQKETFDKCMDSLDGHTASDGNTCLEQAKRVK